jgi:hypothetical protein
VLLACSCMIWVDLHPADRVFDRINHCWCLLDRCSLSFYPSAY